MLPAPFFTELPPDLGDDAAWLGREAWPSPMRSSRHPASVLASVIRVMTSGMRHVRSLVQPRVPVHLVVRLVTPAAPGCPPRPCLDGGAS